jgi:hypothetical protein
MTVMNKVIYLLLPFFIMSAVSASAQVTIGKNEMPRTGAGLDLNTDNLGLLLPQISLTSNTMALTGGNTEGLVIYNTNPSTNDGLQGAGVYLWDGAKWEILTCRPDQPGEITFSTRTVCPEEEFTLSIDEVENAVSYTWTVPAGFTITDGQGSNTVTVFGTGSWRANTSYEVGEFSVLAINECGNSLQMMGIGTTITVKKWVNIGAGSQTIQKNKTLDLCTLNNNGCSGCALISDWSSSNPAVATVSSKGVVKGVAAGAALITGRVVDERGEYTAVSKAIKVSN